MCETERGRVWLSFFCFVASVLMHFVLCLFICSVFRFCYSVFLSFVLLVSVLLLFCLCGFLHIFSSFALCVLVCVSACSLLQAQTAHRKLCRASWASGVQCDVAWNEDSVASGL